MSARFSVQILMFDCDRFILPAIENCAPFVEKIYIARSDLPWSYDPAAREKFSNKTSPDILRQSPHFDKIELVEGDWPTEEAQRNSCLERARAAGFDYMLIQDADEFYTREAYAANLRGIEENPGYDYYAAPFLGFWKSLKYVLLGADGSTVTGWPPFAVDCRRDVAFTRARLPQPRSHFDLPGECFHLSFVLSDDEVRGKLGTWAHAHQFDRERWFRRKWLDWNPAYTRNLHPTAPKVWSRAAEFTGALPPEAAALDVPLAPARFSAASFAWEQYHKAFLAALDSARAVKRKIVK